jgi:hypothetical protein
MSLLQEQQLRRVLEWLAAPNRERVFHYGTHESVPLKADARAAQLAASLGYALKPHHAKRGGELKRDRVLVSAIDILIAAPKIETEHLRSGTWATVRYARPLGLPVVMLSRGYATRTDADVEDDQRSILEEHFGEG